MRPPSVEVLRAAGLATVQDLGRPGLAHLAVPPSGALDRPAHRLANRLVGNPERAATIETTLHGIALRMTRRCYVAVTGAWADVRMDGRPAPWGLPALVEAGGVLDVGPASRGVRSYVGVSGGIAVESVLDSRCTDVFSGIGPPPLRAGDVLPLGTADRPPAAVDAAPLPPPPLALSVRMVRGPRDRWFTEDALRTLSTSAYRVSAASNRTAVRLEGEPLQRRVTDELVSEGLVCGAVEVPPDGQPLVMLADHPTTGGYPVIGVVEAADLSQFAQARPGIPVTFRVSAPPWPAVTSPLS